jgi:hypothetical protein
MAESSPFVTIFLDGLIKRPVRDNVHVYCDWCGAETLPDERGLAFGIRLPDGWRFIPRIDAADDYMCPTCVKTELDE